MMFDEWMDGFGCGMDWVGGMEGGEKGELFPASFFAALNPFQTPNQLKLTFLKVIN